MILVTGGSGQGKRGFSQGAFVKSGQASRVVWCDGSKAGWDIFMREKWGWNFHLFIRRIMLGEVAAPLERMPSMLAQRLQETERPWTQEALKELASFLVQSLLEGNENRILVTEEIGCGIVPADPFERMYREETGRVCCLAAAEARQVWRVCCGLGQRIK